ncbi:Uncharacterised protein [Mycobacterium tuberculosis]|nr:Uncharacterised protein [Mycobacterium tuberculosis]
MVLGPDPLSTPDNDGHNRDIRFRGHSGGPRLEPFELEATADGGLRVDPDQFPFAQPLHRHRIGATAGAPVHRNGPGVPDQEVDQPHPLHLGLDHEPHPATPTMHGQRGRQPIDIAGVIDSDHGAALVGHILLADVGDPGSGGQHQQLGQDL